MSLSSGKHFYIVFSKSRFRFHESFCSFPQFLQVNGAQYIIHIILPHDAVKPTQMTKVHKINKEEIKYEMGEVRRG